MIDIKLAESAMKTADSVGLYGSGLMFLMGVDAVAEACNGCGPEWMSDVSREKLTKYLDLFFPAFCIHDCRFVRSNDGTRNMFDFANDELDRNCHILADWKYSWYDPRRYLWRMRANFVADACRTFGWSAWRDAYGKTKKEK